MRTPFGAAALAAVAAATAACGSTTTDPIMCTAEARPGLGVTVRDSATGKPVEVAGTVVTARADAFADTARYGYAGTDGAVFSLAYERAGTYTVRVERAGYRAWERPGVAVTSDVCHVRTTAVTALLQPAP